MIVLILLRSERRRFLSSYERVFIFVACRHCAVGKKNLPQPIHSLITIVSGAARGPWSPRCGPLATWISWIQKEVAADCDVRLCSLTFLAEPALSNRRGTAALLYTGFGKIRPPVQLGL